MSKAVVLRDAADTLSGVAALQVRLENGEMVTFDMRELLEIPTDFDELLEAGRRAPAQCAFWNYQTERYLDRLRRAEAKLDEEEAKQYLVYRHWYEVEECVEPTEAMVRARLSQDSKIRSFRIALRARKKEYGAVRAVRDSVNSRVHMVRTLIGKTEPT
jgi:hypothetical protein